MNKNNQEVKKKRMLTLKSQTIRQLANADLQLIAGAQNGTNTDECCTLPK
jgi:hypothetical protein